MTTHAYDYIYLNRAARIVGNMLHDAVYVYGYGGEEFLNLFEQSDIASEIENGNPKYVAGRSGIELLVEVVERTSGKEVEIISIENYNRSDVYWAGWMLTYYQWYSGRSFRDIIETVSFDEILGLYGTLHEADIHKSYEVMDAHFQRRGSKLKNVRKRCGLTQEELALQSEVALSTIRAYERKAKDINKAQIDILLRIAKVLKCEVADLLN